LQKLIWLINRFHHRDTETPRKSSNKESEKIIFLLSQSGRVKALAFRRRLLVSFRPSMII
jgi:hypothetical protein